MTVKENRQQILRDKELIARRNLFMMRLGLTVRVLSEKTGLPIYTVSHAIRGKECNLIVQSALTYYSQLPHSFLWGFTAIPRTELQAKRLRETLGLRYCSLDFEHCFVPITKCQECSLREGCKEK